MEHQPFSSSSKTSLPDGKYLESQAESLSTRHAPEEEMPFFLFRGNKVRYLKKGSGPPMIFLHNAGNDHRIWDHQADFFAKSYEVYLVDNLGYGQSDRPELNYTLQLYSKMVSALIKKVGLKDVIIVGQCIGSAMALHYTLRHPEKVRGLVLFNTATIDGLRKGSLGFLYKLTRFRLIRKACMPVVKRLIVTRWRAIMDINQQYGDMGEKDQDFIEHLVRLYRHPKQLQTLASLLFHFDSFGSLDRIHKPTNFPPVCFIWGEQNNILPKETGETLCLKLEPDQKEIIKNCGHLVMRENPERINKIISRFLEQRCHVRGLPDHLH